MLAGRDRQGRPRRRLHAIVATMLRSILLTATCFALCPLTPAQDPRPSLRGTVVDERGQPIEHAVVGFVPPRGALDVNALLASPPTTTDASGAFRIAAPADDRTRTLIVAAPGRQACTAPLRHGDGAVRNFGQILLPMGTTLVGRIRDAQGRPLAGVSVRARNAVPWYSPTGRTVQSGARSNERGIFQVPCVPRTGLRLTFVKTGYTIESRIASHETPLTVTMRPAPIVRGHLLEPDGTPIVDAQVQLQTESLRGYDYDAMTTHTDRQGAFTLTAPSPNGRYRLNAIVRSPQLRRYDTRLLRGAQDDVRINTEAATSPQRVAVHAVDAATGQRLERFTAAIVSDDAKNLQSLLLAAENRFEACEHEATLVPLYAGRHHVVVVAPGHAFGYAAVPDGATAPLVVELGPEAVLRGRVTDENGKPVAGVLVRALPDGGVSGSTSLGARWPRTDAQGRYRIGSLRTGRHVVQVYPDDRAASPPQTVEVEAGDGNTLDVRVRSRQQLRIRITGDLHEGPAPILHAKPRSFSTRGGLRHHVPLPQPVTLKPGQRTFAFGAQQGNTISLRLFVPSRTRVGAGAAFDFPNLTIVDGVATLPLPETRLTVLRGRIECAGDLPTERVAVVATRTKPRPRRSRQDKVVTGVHADGSFELDLEAGTHTLQLVDVETGIVFHTEANDVAHTAAQVLLEPRVHRLRMRIQSQGDGQPTLVRHYEAQVTQGREGCAAFLRGTPRRDGREWGTVRSNGADSVTWLVPTGPLTVRLFQAPRHLERGVGGYKYELAAQHTVDIQEDQHELVLTVPAPPSDALLERPGR